MIVFDFENLGDPVISKSRNFSPNKIKQKYGIHMYQTLFSVYLKKQMVSLSTRPGYFFSFVENRDWNSTDNLKIFGKVKESQQSITEG